jgi:hypothetical protein
MSGMVSPGMRVRAVSAMHIAMPVGRHSGGGTGRGVSCFPYDVAIVSSGSVGTPMLRTSSESATGLITTCVIFGGGR